MVLFSCGAHSLLNSAINGRFFRTPHICVAVYHRESTDDIVAMFLLPPISIIIAIEIKKATSPIRLDNEVNKPAL